MPDEPAVSNPVQFFDLTSEQFDGVVHSWGWPKFRGRQVRDWVYTKAVAVPSAMTNLSRRDQEFLASRVEFAKSAVDSHQVSEDGTHKLLLTWPNGGNAETVMIPDGPRRTACVSSQVGCPV